MRSVQRDATPTSVIRRAFSVLGAFGPGDRGLSLAELVRRTALPKPTVHRLVGDLLELGVLERVDGGYRLGMWLFELGQLVPRQRELREVALPFLQDLYEAVHETAHLAVLDGMDVLYIEKISGHRKVTAGSRIGGRMPAHCTAVGKVLLASSAPERLDEVLAAGLKRRTPYTITLPSVLREHLAKVAQSGFACEREESDLGVVCTAAPVFGFGDRVVAAISVTGPVNRMDPDRLAPTVRLAALGLTRQLAGRPNGGAG